PPTNDCPTTDPPGGWGAARTPLVLFEASDRRVSGTPTTAGVPPPREVSGRVPPDLLHPPEVVDRLMRDHVLHVRPHGEVIHPPVERRPRRILLQLLLDRPYQRQPLL